MDSKLKKTATRKKTVKDREDEIINAAIAVIGSKGLSGATLADIAKKAGIGYGNLTFRFGTKDKLLVASLRFVLEEYTALMDQAAISDIPAPERLQRLINFSFHPSVTTRNKIALWNAFLSECHTRTVYRRIFEDLRQKETERTLTICQEIVTEAGRDDLDPHMLALGINALVEGLWFNMRLGGVTTRQTAIDTATSIVHKIFK